MAARRLGEFIGGKGKVAVTGNVLAAHPDLAGLANNESSCDGAMAPLKSRKAKGVKLVAFDANEQLLAELWVETIGSTVVQNPIIIGYESIREVALKLRGETPASAVGFRRHAGKVRGSGEDRNQGIIISRYPNSTSKAIDVVKWESTPKATLAQLVERLIRNQQVASSILAGGSRIFRNLQQLV